METSVNNKCKAFTSLEQSKKLAEILPIESADMFHLITFHYTHETDNVGFGYKKEITELYPKTEFEYIPCWSLAALLGYLSSNFHIDIRYLDNYWELDCRVQFAYGKELVDACYEIVLKLHELNLL